MNTFKKITYKNTTNITQPFLHNSINLTSINDFPILNKKSTIDNNINDNLNFIDATNKKVIVENKINDDGLCTIYYDKELKKILTHNFPQKMYRDEEDDIDDLDTNSNFVINEPTNTPNKHSIKNPELHHGMNKAIKNIMERRDKFINQYGVDEFIRDYLPKDSPYLYSRYYYRNKYMNYYKNKVNIINNNSETTYENNIINPINENELIQYVDVDVELDIDMDDDGELIMTNDDDEDDEMM